MEQQVVTASAVAQMNEYDRFRGFSCPHEMIDETFLRRIATIHYRRALRTFVTRYAAFLGEYGAPGTVDLFERWLDSEKGHDFETIWHLAFGRMREVIMHWMPPEDILLASARLGLRMVETGTPARFSVRLATPERLRFGRLILPACTHLEAEADGSTLRLVLDGREARFEKNEEWSQASGPLAFAIPTFDAGVRMLNLLVPETPEGHDAREADYIADDAKIVSIQEGYALAMDCLQRFAPLYVPYVNRLLRGLVPIEEPGKYIGGGSFRDNPGVVKLPFVRQAIGLASNLGHETAHQHYYLSRCAGRIDDGSDKSMYHSPFVKADRDLCTLVLTYHAFANEAVVCRMAMSAGLDDPYAPERAVLLRDTLAPIEDILAKSKALTPIGRALWEPVAKQLHQSFR